MTRLNSIESAKSTALEDFRAQTITPQRFMRDLMEFLSLIYGESLSGLKHDDSEVLLLRNPPRKLRYHRLMAVLRAYKLFPRNSRKLQLHAFVRGLFLETKRIEKQQKVYERILQVCRIGHLDVSRFGIGPQFASYAGERLFYHLIEYRFALHNVADWAVGYMCGNSGLSIAFAFSYELYKQYLQTMIDCTDQALFCLMGEHIGPLVVGDLIDRYDYPPMTDDELADLDIAWF